MYPRKQVFIASFIFLFNLLMTARVTAQDSAGIYWQRCIGGYGNEMVPNISQSMLITQVRPTDAENVLAKSDIAVSADKSVLMITTTYSKDGDVKGLRKFNDTTDRYSGDVFVVRFDSTGRIIWKKCLGGSGAELGTAAYALPDGYLIAGHTSSINGDFDGSGASSAYSSPFVIKLDFDGNIKWRKFFSTFGMYGIVEKIKGSPNGSYWILMNRLLTYTSAFSQKWHTTLVNIDANGTQLSTTSFIGNSHTIASSIEIPTDSTVLLAGYTMATTGTITTPWAGLYTGFLSLLKKTGSTYAPLWTKNLWTNNSDHFKIFDMVRTSDGSIYAGGIIFSSFGGKGILFKYDGSGNRNWFKYYESNTLLHVMDTAANCGLVFLSFNGVSPTSYGGSDMHITRLDSSGNVNWRKYYYGTNSDYGVRVKYIRENELFVLGVTNSDSLVPANHNKVPAFPNGYDYNTDMWVMNINPGNIINGKIFHDLDKNGIQTSGEPLISGLWVRSGRNNSRPFTAYASDGNFMISVDTGTYITRPIIPFPNAPFIVKPVADTFRFIGRNANRNISFALQSTANVYDADIDIIPLSFARLGRNITYKITYTNKGSMDLSNTMVTVVKDRRLGIYRVQPAPTQVTGDTLRWNIGALPILASRSIELILTAFIPPVLNLQDTLKLFARINHNNTDVTPADNEKKLEHIIIGAFDPNDKSEIHNGKLYQQEYAQGAYLNYRINFENLGNDTAFYVEVRDTLSKNLDPNSIILTGSSHKCTVNILNDSVVVWKFYNIYLPPKQQTDSLNKGFIAFRVKLNDGLNTGHTIKNNAAIYFDYNYPVITNTANTVITANLVVTSATNLVNASSSISIFPNPTTTPVLQLLFSGDRVEKYNVTLVNSDGKAVFTRTGVQLSPNQKMSFALPNLATGVYFVHMVNTNSYSISKLVYSKR
jgi:uncharacterized repeat protein (TIGR01451 family)